MRKIKNGKMKRNMKKLVLIFMVIMLVIGVIGCSGNHNVSDNGQTVQTTSQDDENIKQDQSETADSKEEIYQDIMQDVSEKSPSELFASGAVFDITRQNHDEFVKIVNLSDALALQKFFTNAYTTFCNDPQVVGFAPSMVDKSRNDTSPATWNTDIMTLSSGEMVALCFMPINNDVHEARIIGIVLGDSGDEYYYCMLDKDEDVSSDVMQNKAMLGIEKIGEVKGRGFELMNNFVECIDNN
ncbi:MAG: hypothetical protein E7413_03230 [Ruminococcaceae bacterium]|nr:hypothetical protein [Oscillospiraceae bacterium]